MSERYCGGSYYNSRSFIWRHDSADAFRSARCLATGEGRGFERLGTDHQLRYFICGVIVTGKIACQIDQRCVEDSDAGLDRCYCWWTALYFPSCSSYQFTFMVRESNAPDISGNDS